MTHQVKAGAQAQFGDVLMAYSGYTLPMSLFLASLQILAVSHLTEKVKTGYGQTLAAFLVLQPYRICKP